MGLCCRKLFRRLSPLPVARQSFWLVATWMRRRVSGRSRTSCRLLKPRIAVNSVITWNREPVVFVRRRAVLLWILAFHVRTKDTTSGGFGVAVFVWIG